MHWEETLQDWGVLSLVYFCFKWRDFIGLYKILAGLDSQEEYVLEINGQTVMTLPVLHSVNAWAVTRTSTSRNTRISPEFILCIYLSKEFLQNGETLKALSNLANVAASVRVYWLICGGIDVLPY